MLRSFPVSLLLAVLPLSGAMAQGVILAEPQPEPGIVHSAAPVAYAPRAKRRLGGGFIEYLYNGGAMAPAGPPAYVVNLGQPGYNGRASLPAGYVAPAPRRRSTVPAYVVNLGQAGYNGRASLPAPYVAPEPRRWATAPAYVVNMGQPGFNGRGELPSIEGGGPVPVRRRTPVVWGGDYAEPAAYAAAPYYEPETRTAAKPAFDPRYARQEVAYDGPQKPGTVVINTGERFLYLVQGDGKALRYGVGVGREGFEWTGTRRIERKAEWPDWRPPSEMLKRRPDLPSYMAGGPNNPLGARAMYLGGTLYRIHGSNEPQSIGHAVSSGCIRMRNEDVIDLYGRVGVGTTVVVM